MMRCDVIYSREINFINYISVLHHKLMELIEIYVNYLIGKLALPHLDN